MFVPMLSGVEGTNSALLSVKLLEQIEKGATAKWNIPNKISTIIGKSKIFKLYAFLVIR